MEGLNNESERIQFQEPLSSGQDFELLALPSFEFAHIIFSERNYKFKANSTRLV